jgi:hypothetical protein
MSTLLVLVLLALAVASCAGASLFLYLLTPAILAGGFGGGPSSPSGGAAAYGGPVGGKPPGLVTKAGLAAYEFVLPKGVRGPFGKHFTMRPEGVLPADACRVRFKVWFDDAWPWTQTRTHNVGGKLGGFKMGRGSASGGDFSSTGASCRVTFNKDRGARAYLYPQLRKAYSGRTVPWSLLDQSPEVQRAGKVYTGLHLLSSKFKMGAWNEVELYVKLNRPGAYDGVLEMVINGDVQRLTSVRYRHTADVRIEELLIQPFFGGGDMSYAPPADMRLWYADFRLSAS